MKDAGNPIPFEEFRRLVAEELQVEESKVVPDASFTRDLFADSIRLVELMLRLEEAGIEIPFEEAWNVETVGDAYRLYTSHRPGPPPAASSKNAEAGILREG
jgi:acyl carrier protein